jgi:prepilin-type N-terminal cleavage/methylation domain-containing protein
MDSNMKHSLQRGFNLLEVLIAIAIFAIGMLALASLQGSLTRAGSDANLRTAATNIAERTIEEFKGFGVIDSGLGVPAYNDIVDAGPVNIVEGGITYSREIDVTEYYYDLPNDNFTDTAPAGIAVSDFKLVEVTVSWGDNAGFQLDENQNLSNVDIGTGEITLSAIMSSVTTQGSARAVSQQDDVDFVPFVNYEPGQNPDIVSLSLGENKFKESLLPQPDVIRQEDLVETRFDVITYSQVGDDDALFLRREEFIAVSCECILQGPPGNPELAGRRPTIWAGDEYAEGHYVDKPYGTSANNQQSPFCGLCCQDHHDGGNSADDHLDTAVNQYYPFRPVADYNVGGPFDGDHKHYNRVQQGNNLPALVEAVAAGEIYLEACKLVRRDGFFRVAQDFRQEDLHIFPADFLDDPAEVMTYSDYVTAAVDAFEAATAPDYEPNPPCIGAPGCEMEPTYGAAYPVPLQAGEFPTWTPLPLGGIDRQQLRSRGVYIDYLSYDMREVVDCLRVGGDEESCKEGDVELDRTMSTNVLEIVPFFDVQLTWLFRWNETPTNTPVDTTNEGLETENTHSRGIATRDAFGCSDVESKGHRGNLGFTDTAPIDGNFVANLRETIIDVESLDAGGLSPCLPLVGNEPVVVGEITETVPGLKVTDIEVVGQGGALCDRTPTGYECTVTAAAVNPAIKLFGYGKDNFNRWACMFGLDLLAVIEDEKAGADAFAIFALSTEFDPQPDGDGYDINIEPNACGEA